MAFRQRFRNLARAFDEELRQRAQRPVLKRDDPDFPARRGELDGQHFDRRRYTRKSHDGGGHDREKAAGRCKPDPQAIGVGVDRRAWRIDSISPKSFGDQRIEDGSCCRPSPRLFD